MSGADENKAWAMLSKHHYAQETMNVMGSLILFMSLSHGPEVTRIVMAKVEAAL
jgi:hypothetical protein